MNSFLDKTLAVTCDIKMLLQLYYVIAFLYFNFLIHFKSIKTLSKRFDIIVYKLSMLHSLIRALAYIVHLRI